MFLKINKVNVPLLYRHGGIHKTKKDKTHSYKFKKSQIFKEKNKKHASKERWY